MAIIRTRKGVGNNDNKEQDNPTTEDVLCCCQCLEEPCRNPRTYLEDSLRATSPHHLQVAKHCNAISVKR